MDDEKWILYNNVEWKTSCEMNHHQPHQRPVFIQRIWCCVYGGIGRESSIMSSFRKIKRLINRLIFNKRFSKSNKYGSQLDQLKAALDEKHPELVNRKRITFHQDNARPYVSLMTRQKLLELGWEVLIHPPYSPDIAPSDFHLFRSLPNSLNGKKFQFLGKL